MAKKHRRFGRLHQTLKELGYSVGTPQDPTKPTAVQAYYDYLTGKATATVPRKADSKLLKTFDVGVLPFGLDPVGGTGGSSGQTYQGSITYLANNIAAKLTSTDANFGISRDGKAIAFNGFYPAIAHVTVIPSSASFDKVPSQYTKKPYNKYPTRSGGIPFGRTVTGVKLEDGSTPADITHVGEEDVATAILKTLKGSTANDYTVRSVSFTQEVYPEQKNENIAQDTTVSADIPA